MIVLYHNNKDKRRECPISFLGMISAAKMVGALAIAKSPLSYFASFSMDFCVGVHGCHVVV